MDPLIVEKAAHMPPSMSTLIVLQATNTAKSFQAADFSRQDYAFCGLN